MFVRDGNFKKRIRKLNRESVKLIPHPTTLLEFLVSILKLFVKISFVSREVSFLITFFHRKLGRTYFIDLLLTHRRLSDR